MPRQLNPKPPDGVQREWFTCTACRRTLPRTPEYFDRCNQRSDGMVSECKECRRVRRQAWRETYINDDPALDEVRAWLYTIAYLKHGREKLYELAIECHNGATKWRAGDS